MHEDRQTDRQEGQSGKAKRQKRAACVRRLRGFSRLHVFLPDQPDRKINDAALSWRRTVKLSIGKGEAEYASVMSAPCLIHLGLEKEKNKKGFIVITMKSGSHV